MRPRLCASLFLCMGLLAPLARCAEIDELLTTIQAVGAEGKGNVAAGKAWKELTSKGLKALLPTLKALDEGNFRARNWLRSAVNSLVEKAKAGKSSLPIDKLENYIVRNPNRGPGRKLAFDLIAARDPNARDRLLPGLTNDPSSGLRRAAIAYQLEKAATLLKDNKKDDAKEIYQSLLPRTRDQDQVETIAKALKPYGVKVDLAKHFGFIQSWHVITPFDNRKGVGYAEVYPPEKEVKLDKVYDGKEKAKAKWTATTTTDTHGKVDLNEVLGKHKGAVAYAYVVIHSPKKQPVEVRAGSITALKMWLNGKEIFSREEYHHGMRMDQYIGFGTLNKGRNELLLKVCQNEQTERWAQKWQFQVRLCDHLGGAIPFRVVSPTKDESKAGGVK